MKLRDIRTGGKYEGPKGEVRTVVRIWDQYGGVVVLDWISDTHKTRGRADSGQTTPQQFARWAHRHVPTAAPQEPAGAGDAGAAGQA